MDNVFNNLENDENEGIFKILFFISLMPLINTLFLNLKIHEILYYCDHYTAYIHIYILLNFKNCQNRSITNRNISQFI